jgi:hypothetical protein
VFNGISRISSYDDIESKYDDEKGEYDEMPDKKYRSIRYEYNSDVEYLLRINHAGRKFTMRNAGSGVVVAGDRDAAITTNNNNIRNREYCSWKQH